MSECIAGLVHLSQMPNVGVLGSRTVEPFMLEVPSVLWLRAL
jgi:hypothetical protein